DEDEWVGEKTEEGAGGPEALAAVDRVRAKAGQPGSSFPARQAARTVAGRRRVGARCGRGRVRWRRHAPVVAEDSAPEAPWPQERFLQRLVPRLVAEILHRELQVYLVAPDCPHLGQWQEQFLHV